MKIYFAGSIRGGRDDFALYFEIIEQLKAFGEVLTEHVGDARLEAIGESGSDKEIHDRDLGWLKEADCLVAEVTTPSLGVGYEIAKTIGWNKPVLCLFRSGQGRVLSAMIAGSGVTVREYRSTAEVKQILAEFCAGLATFTRSV
jgi:2'-deoxynucleoside 5'-phosphate N-hydrolase